MTQPQPGRTPLVPAYHEIVAGEPKYTYSTNVRALAAQIAVLATVHMSSPQATFDDAHRSQYELAFPLLEDTGLKGVFFAIPQRAESWSDYMSWAQLREIVRSGHEVQSHGFSHVPLTRCSDADLHREVETSRLTLEDKLGAAVDAISIPFGRWDKRVIDACRGAGYRRVYTSDARPRAVRNGLELIGRFMVRNTMGPDRFRQLLLASPASLLLLRTKQLARDGVRRLVGDRNYHLLWCYLSGDDSENIKSEYV